MESLSASLSEVVVKAARRLMGAHCGAVSTARPARSSAGIVLRCWGDREIWAAELLISYLEVLDPTEHDGPKDPLLVLFVGESGQNSLAHWVWKPPTESRGAKGRARKKGRKGGKGGKGGTSGEVRDEAHAKAAAWRAIAQKVGRKDWKEYARGRLEERGGPLAGRVTGRKAIKALFAMARKGKSPKAFAAAVLLSEALGVTMTHVVRGEDAAALWGPTYPKATVAAPKKKVKDRTEEIPNRDTATLVGPRAACRISMEHTFDMGRSQT
jgi:hypothetical protein